ncbi:hypothetical protein RF11_14455 [Thelohanellus kitauei]|uniref:Uncharacterized protein n=1 Tax=Thelohanellus kitauei TaxID=669202 RepID=A0A0C2JNW5_THEKT|nr:hypothetical protein RF11_14455 [Thelohanellus kitauei]
MWLLYDRGSIHRDLGYYSSTSNPTIPESSPRSSAAVYPHLVDQCKGSETLDGYPMTSAESRRLSHYPERKRTIKIGALEFEGISHAFMYAYGGQEDPAFRGLAIIWIANIGSRLDWD